MLLLLFRLGPDRYAIDAAEVLEVLPMVEWKEVPRLPPGVVGVFSRQGVPIPLIDLQLILCGTVVRPRFGTRIIVVRYSIAGSQQSLGLLAEEVTETIRRAESDFAEPGVRADGTRALGRVVQHESGLIQLVHPHNLLPAEVMDTLYATAQTSA